MRTLNERRKKNKVNEKNDYVCFFMKKFVVVGGE